MTLVLTGCQSFGFFNDATPQVSGRVLAVDTQKPLTGVKIVRGSLGQPPQVASQPKGAQLLQANRPVLTDTNGDFILPGRSYVTFFRPANGWSVRLSFQAAGYVSFQTNFMTADISSNSPAGEPLILTGDILLKPLSP